MEIDISDKWVLKADKRLVQVLDNDKMIEQLRGISTNLDVDGIILHSLESKRGSLYQTVNNLYLYESGEHYKINAALLKKDLTLTDLNSNRKLKTLALYPRLYFDPETDTTQYGKTESIKTRLSFIWLVINTLFFCLVLYVIYVNFPRNRYYHIENKRIVLEPNGWW